MLRPQDKNKQMEELMKQNEMLMSALQNANQLMEQIGKQSGRSGPSGQSDNQDQQQLNQQTQQAGQCQQDQQSNQAEQGQQDQQASLAQDQQALQSGQGSQASQAQCADQIGQQNQQQNQQNNQQQGQQQGVQVNDLTCELIKIKGLVASLECRTANFVSNNTNKALNEKDVVGLVLILIDGMVDWATDFINNKQNCSNN